MSVYLLKSLLSAFLGMCPEVELLGHTVILLLIARGASVLFSTVATPSYIPMNRAQAFNFLTSSSAHVVFCFLDSSQPHRCEMVLTHVSLKIYNVGS